MSRLAVVLGGVVLLAACASRPVKPEPQRAWTAALAAADAEAGAGRYATADSMLERFAVDNPTSPDTLEALFWRALYLVDPANPSPAGSAAATPMIDRYFAAATPADQYWRQAEVIRRFAAIQAAPPVIQVDTVRIVDSVAVRRIVAREVEARGRALEGDLQQLRDSLTRTAAELDRIRRRLAPTQPRP